MIYLVWEMIRLPVSQTQPPTLHDLFKLVRVLEEENLYRLYLDLLQMYRNIARVRL